MAKKVTTNIKLKEEIDTNEKPSNSRGRPKKQQPLLVNEDKNTITMSSRNQQLMNKPEVGEVVDSNKNMPAHFTLDDLQKRWGQVFSKYGTQLSFDQIRTAWETNVSMLNNPFIQNERVKRINDAGMKATKDGMQAALDDPEHQENALRSISMRLYYTNYIYQTLVHLNRETPKYNYYPTPLYVNIDEDKDGKKLKSDSEMVDKILKKFCPKLTFKTVANQVNMQGKASYFVRTSYNDKKKNIDFLLLQKINSDRLKITGFGSKQQFVVSFNMIIFLEPGYDTSQYPQFIQDAWEEMINNGIVIKDKKGNKMLNPKASLPSGHTIETTIDGSYMYWVKLPQDLCYTFYSDGSHPNMFPDFLGLFNDFNDLDNYRWLQGNLLSKGVNSILTAEVPLV